MTFQIKSPFIRSILAELVVIAIGTTDESIDPDGVIQSLGEIHVNLSLIL